MNLNTQTLTQIVSSGAAAIQAACSYLLDFNPGSELLAWLQGVGSVGLWLQSLITNTLLTTRLATSSGSDVDSFVNDYSLTRSPASYASGSVVFSRYSSSIVGFIPVGASVKTSDGTQSFTVIQDNTNPYWVASLGGYQIPIGQASGTFTVSAVNAGSQGNVLANTITLISSPLSGVDTVINLAGFTNGIDQESDAALKAQFTNYINTRSQATDLAVQYAISTVQPGLSWSIQENVSTVGMYQPGNFVVTVDDGTGNPSSSVLAAVANAVNSTRPLSVSYAVLPPVVVTASVSMTITAAQGYVKSALQPYVANAVVNYVNTLGVGNALPYSRLSQVAYDATPGIQNVNNITLNGGYADLGGNAVILVRTSLNSVAIN